MMRRTVSFSKNATNIFLHVLTRCNLRCTHCYINPAQHGDGMLAPDTIERWLAALFHPKRPANLILLGGEPTLHPQLDRVVELVRNRGVASVTIDTNGYLFNNILQKVDTKAVDFFSFSLDGATAERNDAIRGPGSFAACTAGIRAAADKGFGVSLIYTVSTRNIDELALMPALLEQLPVQRFFIQVIGLRGRSAAAKGPGPSSAALQVREKKWKETVSSTAARIAADGIAVTFPKVYLDDDEPFECAAVASHNYFIFPNGRVYRCPLCEDFPLHSLAFRDDRLVPTDPINEWDLVQLEIPEGCVMNRLIQPGNIRYRSDGRPAHRIACCLLKETFIP